MIFEAMDGSLVVKKEPSPITESQFLNRDQVL